MKPFFRAAAWLPLLFGAAACAHAQGDGLHAAFEAAWLRQPAQQAQAARQAELDARLRAASALTPAPASVSVSQRSDQIGSRLGRREAEIEFDVPLWLPGQQGRERALARAEGGVYAAQQRLARWRLAGELRAAYWQARIDADEHALALQRSAGAQALAADVARRVKAGELARIDANRATGEEQGARIAAGQAEAQAFRSLQQFTVLTGMATLPAGADTAAAQPAASHPQRALDQQQLALAQRRVEQVDATRREPPELTLGMARERPAYGAPHENSVVLRLKVPFAADGRNLPRMAAAQAERAEADAALAQGGERTQAEIAAARRELAQAQSAAQLSEQRMGLARDTQQLLARAFSLGEIDLPARLRAEAERFEADRAAVRARLEVGRATANLNQALGILP
ncbi:MAG: TolC family protein [Pseudomonadota bacterium]